MAQSIISGRIVDENNQPLSPVTVVNINTQQASLSTTSGAFSIYAKAGEVITFSYIGYDVVEYTITEETKNKNIKINMHPLSYRLNEFILRPNYTPYQLDSIEKQKIYTPALSRTHSSVMSPVSFIAERISGRSKQIFRFQKNLEQWENDRYIDTRYTPQLVQELTGLSGDTIGYFMNAYPMEHKFARAATELELKMWIKYNYRSWRKNGSPVDSNLYHIEVNKPE